MCPLTEFHLQRELTTLLNSLHVQTITAQVWSGSSSQNWLCHKSAPWWDMLPNKSSAFFPVPKLQKNSMIFILSRRLITTCCSHTMSEQKQNVPSSCCGITIPYRKGLLMLDMLLHLRTIGKKIEKSYPWLSSVERVKFQVRLANIHKFSDFYI